MGSSGSAEQKAALDFDLKKVKIRRHVDTTEDAYRARVTDPMYGGSEYNQLDDQVMHVGHVATAGLTLISVTGL